MQLIRFTAADGHSELWQPSLAVQGLKLLYSYLSDPDQDSINDLALQVKEFVGDDVDQVHSALIYAQSVNDGLFPMLDIISNRGHVSMAQVYFTLKAMDKDTPYNHHTKRTSGLALVDVISTTTNNDQDTIKGLARLAKLFVDGQLSYSSLEVQA